MWNITLLSSDSTKFDCFVNHRCNGKWINWLLIYYEAEGGVLELLETGAPYAPHIKAKITWKRKLEFLLTHSVWNEVKVVCAVFRQVLDRDQNGLIL